MVAGICYDKVWATSRSLGALTFTLYYRSPNLVPFSVFVMLLGVQLFEAIFDQAFFKFLSRPFATILRAPATIGITLVSTFHNLFSSLAKS